MSESGCGGFLEGDQSAGELEQGEVVLGFLRPAYQERAVAVEPGVAGVVDPGSGAPAGSGAFQFEFVAAPTDVRREAAAERELVDPRVVGSRRRDRGAADARRTARAGRSAPSRASALGAWSRGGWRRHAPPRSGSPLPRREANVSPPPFA